MASILTLTILMLGAPSTDLSEVARGKQKKKSLKILLRKGVLVIKKALRWMLGARLIALGI